MYIVLCARLRLLISRSPLIHLLAYIYIYIYIHMHVQHGLGAKVLHLSHTTLEFPGGGVSLPHAPHLNLWGGGQIPVPVFDQSSQPTLQAWHIC